MLPGLLNTFLDYLLPIFLVIALSAYLGKKLALDTKMLSSLVVNVFTPFLVIQTLSSSHLEGSEVGKIAIMALAAPTIMLIAGIGISKLMKLSRNIEGAFVLSVFLGNMAAMGFSINEFVYGPDGLQRAVLYFAIATAYTTPVAIFFASRGKRSAMDSFKNVIKSPITYATILGLILNFTGRHLPLPLERFTELMAQSTVPGLLIILGVQLGRIKVRSNIGAVIAASATRLILAPAAGFALAALLGMSGLTRSVSIIESSVPTALFATAFAIEFGSDGDFTTAVSLVTTIGSVITLTLLITLL